MPDNTLLSRLDELRKEDRDLYFYSGDLDQRNVNTFIERVFDGRQRGRTNVSLCLTTYGGNPGQAFRMARMLQNLYGSFRLVVLGPCKSAGTLVAVGAAELAMTHFGELGPLDVQIVKHDEIAAWSSGLDTLGAVARLRSEAFQAFEEHMLAIVRRSRGTVSTKTACDVAAKLVTGLFQPIASRIDPHRLAEVDRMMRIARAYGERLRPSNFKSDDVAACLDTLISDYPTHEFIIDFEQASEIFSKVSQPSEAELLPLELFPRQSMNPGGASAEVCDVVAMLGSSIPEGGQHDPHQEDSHEGAVPSLTVHPEHSRRDTKSEGEPEAPS